MKEKTEGETAILMTPICCNTRPLPNCWSEIEIIEESIQMKVIEEIKMEIERKPSQNCAHLALNRSNLFENKAN